MWTQKTIIFVRNTALDPISVIAKNGLLLKG